MPHESFTMVYQTRIRAEGAQARFDHVLGKEPRLKSGKGKYYFLNHAGLKEVYERALQECPMAADAILVLLWDAAHQFNTLEFLAKDFEEQKYT